MEFLYNSFGYRSVTDKEFFPKEDIKHFFNNITCMRITA